jgi:hypothetical protein
MSWFFHFHVHFSTHVQWIATALTFLPSWGQSLFSLQETNAIINVQDISETCKHFYKLGEGSQSVWTYVRKCFITEIPQDPCQKTVSSLVREKVQCICEHGFHVKLISSLCNLLQQFCLFLVYFNDAVSNRTCSMELLAENVFELRWKEALLAQFEVCSRATEFRDSH